MKHFSDEIIPGGIFSWLIFFRDEYFPSTDFVKAFTLVMTNRYEKIKRGSNKGYTKLCTMIRSGNCERIDWDWNNGNAGVYIFPFNSRLWDFI